jgi:hypothetical protein
MGIDGCTQRHRAPWPMSGRYLYQPAFQSWQELNISFFSRIMAGLVFCFAFTVRNDGPMMQVSSFNAETPDQNQLSNWKTFSDSSAAQRKTCSASNNGSWKAKDFAEALNLISIDQCFFKCFWGYDLWLWCSQLTSYETAPSARFQLRWNWLKRRLKTGFTAWCVSISV